MNLEARKIEFVQEFLKLDSEDVISRLENILRKEKTVIDEASPMTKEVLNNRIDKSELDFINGRYKSSSELLTKYS